MTRRIQEDHKEFRDVIEGKVRDQIKKYIKNGKLVGLRPNGDKFLVNVPHIDPPSFRYGKNKKNWGRGPGGVGDVIGKEPGGDKGKKGKPGDIPGDTMPVGVDLKYVLQFLKEELQLPNLKPKDSSEIFREKTIYNGLRKTGPESLRHTRKTMRNAMVRMMQTDEYDEKNPIIVPIQDDKRYRSWNIKQLPESNAVIFFARDWSGSMDDEKCDIVSNTSWWLDCWIKQFYERTETVYIGHDTRAEVCDQEKFYKHRYGGGTMCSSAFKLIKEKIKIKYPIDQWNIYVFYFSDGENYDSDNEKVAKMLTSLQTKCNAIGIGQILHYSFMGGGRSFIEEISTKMSVDPNVLRFFDYKAERSQSDQEIQMIKKFLSTNNIEA